MIHSPFSLRLFSTDLDGTLLGDPAAVRAFTATWDHLKNGDRPLLCYNTGRLVEDTRKLVESGQIPAPDYLICGVGTAIYDFRKGKIIKEFHEVLEEGWNLKKVEKTALAALPGLRRQPKHLQTPYKSSWFLEDASPEQLELLQQSLEKAKLATNIVYSSNRDLDILPRWANKGNALEWLLRKLKIDPREVLVAGDSGNDSAMFRIKSIRGIVVENAQPELIEATQDLPVYRAHGHAGEGILEGLVHYGLIDSIRIPDKEAIHPSQFEAEIQHLVRQEAHADISPESWQFLREGYFKAVEGLRRNITPMGFSACSLSDNTARGTDENYRSVWARDGAITLIGTLSLEDADIRACQRQTLETLLSHISPTGQIPANVHIEHETPDYSGVGGICSIDSGLWIIIAFYEYVRKTNDIELLRSHRESLQRAMNWLSAHDANNDALLEIPEAGDWTDLFGRSYNVLYDEVLWYRANVCFGRMMEILGDSQRAGDYLRWSRSIRNAILNKFWPSTQHSGGDFEVSFADRQFQIGDTHYLIAQVTPFSFDWRCDILGNVLALLYNVLDAERARIAFWFMWGTGVNNPYPVANLYPPVQAGDPEWRSYYTVNLLNLPHHYHNGGLWPFVGAMWVRFINRIGLRQIALQELIKLAELNHKGTSSPWEFNEWAHGTTGRPMGKAYQAWSCAEFIHAFDELGIVPTD